MGLRRERALTRLLLVTVVMLAAGCQPCDDLPAFQADADEVSAFFPSEWLPAGESRPENSDLMGASRWIIVRSTGPTTWSRGGYVAVATHQWGRPIDGRVVAESELVNPGSVLGFGFELFTCPQPDDVPPVGTVFYRGIRSDGEESDLLVPARGDTATGTALDDEFGYRSTVNESIDDVDWGEWNGAVTRPRSLLLAVLGLATLLLGIASAFVTRNELRNRFAASPPERLAFGSLQAGVVWAFTGPALSFLLMLFTIDWLRVEWVMDVQPNASWRDAAATIAMGSVAIAAARPWLPASATAWSATGCVAACFYAAGSGPWLLVLPVLLAGLLVRGGDLGTGTGWSALILMAAAIALSVTVLLGLELILLLITVTIAAVVGLVGAPFHQRWRDREIAEPTADRKARQAREEYEHSSAGRLEAARRSAMAKSANGPGPWTDSG